MIQWEYLQCSESEFYDWKTSLPHYPAGDWPKYNDDTSIDSRIISNHKSFIVYLNYLGDLGWELVHWQTLDSKQDRLLFKRPKES